MNETPLFFSSNGSRLFGVLHRPEAEDRHKAFVFCHPFAEEKLWAHRVFVTFARELANCGYTVLRFDYRGYGDSDGEFAEFNASHHLQDIVSAIEFVKTSGDSPVEIGLLGHRLGANLGLFAAESTNVSGPLILWDPITNTERYIHEFLRSNLTTQLSVYGEIRETRERLIERMEAGELVNVDGYDFAQTAYNEIAALDFTGPVKRPLPNRSLFVQVGKKETPKKDIEALSTAFGATLVCVIEEPFWREIKRWYFRADNLFVATLAWLENSR